MPVEGVDGWPLYWPDGWTRTEKWKRQRSRYETHFVKARDVVVKQLKLMGGRGPVISTNIPLRQDGLPLANMREPADPGVAVYWNESKWPNGSDKQVITTRVLACDKWVTVRENLRAIGLTIEALRSIDRAGASQVLDRAFMGMTALPASTGHRHWRDVLKLDGLPHATWEHVEVAYKLLALERHPDRGGTNEQMVELNRARDEARQELGR